MHGDAVYIKEGLPFAQVLSLENPVDSYLCFLTGFTPFFTYFFSSIDHLLHLCVQFFILFHLT